MDHFWSWFALAGAVYVLLLFFFRKFKKEE